MRARLEYIAGSERVLLEEMELCELDQYTCKNFNKLEDIKSNSKYKKLLAGVSENGSFRIFFNTDEIPLRDLERYVLLGGNPMQGEESLAVVVGQEKIQPNIYGIREKMASFISNEQVAREFYQTFETEYSAKEKLDFLIGMDAENSSLAARGIRRIMSDYTSGYEGYFMGRMFIERLKSFESVKTATSVELKRM